MAVFTYKLLNGASMRLRCLVATVGLLAWAASLSLQAAPPFLSLNPHVATNASAVQLTLTGDANYIYVIQGSTDLQHWTPLLTNRTGSSNATFTAFLPATNNFSFFRAKALGPAFTPCFSAAIVVRTNFNLNVNGISIDSFDSSTPVYSTAGLYDPAKSKANGDVATDSGLAGALNIGNGTVYGHVMTGPGSQQSSVSLGIHGTVGDMAWNASTNSGIEPGHWSGNFNMNIPDIFAPNTAGWNTSLPPAVNGSNTLNGNYVLASGPSLPLYVAGPTTLWVKGSVSLGVTIAPTNNAKLVLYVGTTTGSGDSMSFSGNGTMNHPGNAANFQIYGLPSLAAIDFRGNNNWVATVYAPEASFTAGGGGNTVQDCSGAIVVNSVIINSHWNFHYDESLKNSGIGY